MNGLAGLSGLSAVSGLGGRRNLESSSSSSSSSSSRGGTGHTHTCHMGQLWTHAFIVTLSQNGLKRLFRQIFSSWIFFGRGAAGYLITLRNRWAWAGMHGGLCNTLKIFVTLFTHHPLMAVLPCAMHTLAEWAWVIWLPCQSGGACVVLPGAGLGTTELL